jgi:hypothetical protein
MIYTQVTVKQSNLLQQSSGRTGSSTYVANTEHRRHEQRALSSVWRIGNKESIQLLEPGSNQILASSYPTPYPVIPDHILDL